MAKENGVKTYYKGLGFCGGAVGSNSCEVDVKDGKIVRIRPMRFDKQYTPEQMNAWTLTARGKSFSAVPKSLIPPFSVAYKTRAYSDKRILYPMKRVDFDPNGERNPQNRGKSKFVRISWEEALDILTSELKRVIKEYGPYSVLLQMDGHGETKCVHGPHGCQADLMELLGGYTYQARQPDSWEGWHWGAKHVWGQAPLGQGDQYNLWLDVSRNCDMLLYWGADPETTPWAWGGQQAGRLCYWFTELGIKQVFICPDVNYACAVHADKWIPVYPNTDAALQLAIIYTWLKEDLWDKEYVKTHAVGYDIFFKYVLGEEDGIAKTPEWAAPICGVPSRIIKALARKWHKERTTIAHCNGGSYIRSCYSHEPARLEVLMITMQGLGKPGRNVLKFIEWQMFGLNSAMPGPRSEVIPNVGAAYHGWHMGIAKSFIPKTLIPKALKGNYTADHPLKWYSFPDASFPPEQQFIEYQYPIEGANPVHMIWSDAPCWTTCWNGGNDMIEAFRSPNVEFIVMQHPWLENDCLFADLLLPVSTKFEQKDISVDICGGNFNIIFLEDQCIEPVGEAKSDWEICCEVAKRLGPDIYEKYTEGMTVEDFIRRGFEQSGVEGYLSYDEFKEKKYFVVPTAKDWENDPCGFENFYKDPEHYPLETATGKVQFYSEELAQYFPDDQERPPYPKFIPYGESHQESRLHPRSDKYPYLIVSNHPRWRCHAQLDDIHWLREILTCKVKGPDGYLYEPVWINPVDAEKLGVRDGDVVKIYNDRGWVLGGVYVTERIFPGVVLQDHGARLDPIVPGEADRGGANNLICPTNTTSKNAVGEVTSGYLVAVEKVNVFELAKQYPEAFNREFDVRGVCLNNWIKEGE